MQLLCTLYTAWPSSFTFASLPPRAFHPNTMAGPLQAGDIVAFGKLAWEVYQLGFTEEHNASKFHAWSFMFLRCARPSGQGLKPFLAAAPTT